MTNTEPLPGTTFAGYERERDVHWRLVAAVNDVMKAHPTLRFGQILFNALGVGTDVFNMYDEDMIAKLEGYRGPA